MTTTITTTIITTTLSLPLPHYHHHHHTIITTTIIATTLPSPLPPSPPHYHYTTITTTIIVCICACLQGFSPTRQGYIFKRLVLIVATCDLPTTDAVHVSYENNSHESLCPAISMRVTKNHIMRFCVLRCSQLPRFRKNIIKKELAE
jgi:hypothetical protein